MGRVRVDPFRSAPGQISRGLAVDAAGNLYVALGAGDGTYYEIRRRDAQGNESVIATGGFALGQVEEPSALAVDTAGSLYVAESNDFKPRRVQKYTPHP